MREVLRYAFLPALVGGSVGLLIVWLLAGDDAPDRPGYAAAVRRAAPAVVNIYSTSTARPAICEQPGFKELCERFSGAGRSRMRGSLGSGVVVHPDGYILTNHHVIRDADEITVMFADGTSASADLVGRDLETDLAVIRIPLGNLTPIQPGSSDDVQVGDVALAIGNPFGIGQTVSAGIVSAKGRAGISRSPYDDFIQTDAAINPGNSGGALVDADGYLIGINSMIFSTTGDSNGVGFAIPAKLAFEVLGEIIATGRVTRGWIGVTLTGVAEAATGPALRITHVAPDGPGAAAGLRAGDVIVAVDKQPALGAGQLSRAIAAVAPGDVILLEVERDGERLEVQARAGERPEIP